MGTKTSVKPGRRPKVAGGLNEVLFLRANRRLLDGLDELVRRQNEEGTAFHATTRADVARELLCGALAKEGIDVRNGKVER